MGVFQVHNGKTVEIPQEVLTKQHEAIVDGGPKAGDAVVAKFMKGEKKVDVAPKATNK